jgi:hypothetical protein
MSKKRTRVKTDPELIRQLDQTASNEDMVEAVFTLRLSTKQLLAPTRVEEVTNKVLDRVSQQIGIDAKEVNIFRNLGAFVISAPPSFIRELLSEPEIASAIANQQPKQIRIPTVK